MKYLKKFEDLDKQSKLRISIIENVTDLFWEVESDDIDWDDCVFAPELAVIYQRDHIDEIYDSEFYKDKYDISREEFVILYNKILKESIDSVIIQVIENTQQYKYVEDYNLDIPEYIKKVSVYNL